MPDGHEKTGDESSRELKKLPTMTEATAHSPSSGLLRDYEPGAAFDELLDENGAARRHYSALLQNLEELGSAELKRRHDTCKQLVHEQGITYHVYGDTRGID